MARELAARVGWRYLRGIVHDTHYEPPADLCPKHPVNLVRAWMEGREQNRSLFNKT
jgi:hypothetical protein